MTVGQHPRSAAPGYMAPHSVSPTIRRQGPPPVGPPPPSAPPVVRPGRPRPPKRRHRVRNWTLGVLGVLVLLPLLAFVVGWMIFKVPAIGDEGIVQTATYTFAGGEPIAVVRPKDSNDNNINRNIVTIDKVPAHVRQAVLAAEDRSFYSNPGFDPVGIARAVYNQVTGGVGGGSTITQQYVKVSTGQDQASLWRKYKEIILSIKISKEQTKDQILENYLNTVYFGRGAYGIQAAAQAYFGEDVGQLSISQGAMLAGMIQSPSALDPMKNPAGVTIRWTYTLDQMQAAGFLPAAERSAQKFPEVLPAAPIGAGVPADDRYHIFERAQAELRANGISQEEIDTGGLTVTTTIDANRQKAAVDAVTKVMKTQPANLRTALVAVDPRNGAIQAYFGGSNGPGIDYAGDAVTRPPGSTFKPFVVAAALQSDKQFGLGTQYAGTSPMVIAGTKVANSDGDSCDECTVMSAMTKSTNTVFYQIAVQYGPQNVAQTAHAAGIPDNLLPDPSGGISLGDKPVHVVDMAAAYGTFAADGQRYDPHIVQKVTAADGRILLDRGTTPVGQQSVFTQQLARNVTESMLDVPGTSGFALAGGRTAAAKTGTNQLGETRDNRDAWTVGYTPSLSTAVWVGSDKSDPIRTRSGAVVYGRTLPGPIWEAFMNAALKGTPDEDFSPYEPMGTAAYANSGGGSSYDGSSTTATPSPDSNNGDNNNGDNNGDKKKKKKHDNAATTRS